MRTPSKSILLLVLLYLLFGGIWIVGSDYLLGQIFPDPAATAGWQTVKGLAFIFGTALFFYLGLRSTAAAVAVRCALERTSSSADHPSSHDSPPQRLTVRVPVTIFLLLVLILAATGGAISFQIAGAMRNHQGVTLRNMAGQIARQIAAWRQERSGDAAIITDDKDLMVAIGDWLQRQSPESPVPDRITRRLKVLQQAGKYRSVMICDVQGRQRYPAPGQAGQTVCSAALLEALQHNRAVFSAFHNPASGQAENIDFFVPLTGSSGGNQEVSGALVLCIEGKSRLFPALQGWQGKSPGAETRLVQRLGDGSFSVISFGPDKNANPAVDDGPDRKDPLKAFLARLPRPGLFDVLDDRGLPVLAVVEAVPDSDWLLIAKIDQAEIHRPIRRLALISGAVMLFLIGTAGVGVGLWWRQQVAKVALERLQGQLQRRILRTHYQSLLKLANDIILLLDDQGRIVEANDRAVVAYGYARTELLGRDVRQLRAPDALADFDRHWHAACGEGALFETRHRRADGRTFPVEVSARRIEAGGKVWCQSIIRNISERKLAEQKIRRLTSLYNVLSQTNQAIVHHQNRQELFQDICRIAVELGFLRMAVITSIDLSAEKVSPAAACGADQSFLDTINFQTLRGFDGHGPTMKVVGERRPYVCNDVAADPSLQYRQEAAECFGFQSAAVFPLYCGGQIFGTLNLYAAEKDFFDPDLVAVLEEMAADITFALNNFEREAARKKAEERLLETSATLRALYQATPLPVMITDPEGRTTFWNPAAEQVFGWTEDEVVGRTPPLVSADEQGEFLRNLARVKNGEPLRGVEVRRQRRDGRLLDMLLFAAPLCDVQGQVSGIVALFMDVSEQKRARDHIVCLAHYDQLTGLANRTLLREGFVRETSRARREGHSLALCLLDFDKFKTVNDALGHSLGDKLLIQAARRLEDSLRPTDVICRPGGDEFLLLLSGLENPQDSGKVARKILQNLARPFSLEGHTVRMSASMGITIFPEDGLELDTLFRNADTAMYAAKEKGRNRFMFFRGEMDQRIRDRLDLENTLRTALEERTFFLHYQPQVAIGSGRIIGAEALLRYRHPERGLIPPDKLIPVAEDSGLIVPIGEWILDEACRQLHLWREKGLTDLTMAINLSPVQIFQEDFAIRAKAIFERHRIPPGRLNLELTESIFMAEDERVRQTLLDLKKLGLGISLDDFGTGYSSLSYLKRYAVDEIKIDRAFIQDVCSDPGDAAIVRATIQMAHSLGLNTVAEGVETAEQLEFLRQQQCDLYQGYLCSRPLPADEFYSFARP
jgi:diguanylate cyclase (GGDEF)-like protein/PAS domain S-box-containing protein